MTTLPAAPAAPAAPADPTSRTLFYDDPAEVTSALAAWKSRDAVAQQIIADQAAQIVALTPVDPIKWGASVYQFGTPPESYASALARNESTFGASDPLIRYYGPNGDPKWPTVTGSHPLVYSWKYLPADVLSGVHDTALKAFAAATPAMYTADNPVEVSYWHEPEDEIEKGTFTAAQYRAAWQHIADLIRASGKPIRLNLILMGWTLDPASGRNWRDFYQAGAVDVLAWDTYVWGPKVDVPTMFDRARAIAASTGKPWAIAETGVGAVQFPDPTTRNAKLSDVAKELTRTDKLRPAYVTYFDTTLTSSNPPAYDWSISRTPAAVEAWKAGRTA